MEVSFCLKFTVLTQFHLSLMIRWLLNHLQIIRKVLEPFLIDLKLIIQDRLIFSLLLLFFDRPTDRGLDKKIEFIQAY